MDYDNKTISVVTERAAAVNSLMKRVFLLMSLGIGLTAIVAWYFSSTPSLYSLLRNEQGMSGLGFAVMFAPLAFVLIMSFGYQKLSAPVLALLFGLYAIINGVSFSFIFLTYTTASIYKTFAITAGMFGIMALLGYTTKVDLTRFGSIMIMGLFGIIIAFVVNIFMKSAAFDYIISIAGVVIFTGLTAWDVQKIRRLGESPHMTDETYNKMSVMGALTLYLDFINLFLFLLRFFGRRE